MSIIPLTNSPVRQFRDYKFVTEPEACQHFDEIVERSHIGGRPAFKLYKEVPGEILQPRSGADRQGVRIDRILLPLKIAIDNGWRHGAIGVECKRSDVSAGKAVCQAMDYSRSAFTLPDFYQTVICKWVFIYPLTECPKEDLASIMAHHRIGHVSYGQRLPLVFSSNQSHAIIFQWEGNVDVRGRVLQSGQKAGSR